MLTHKIYYLLILFFLLALAACSHNLPFSNEQNTSEIQPLSQYQKGNIREEKNVPQGEKINPFDGNPLFISLFTDAPHVRFDPSNAKINTFIEEISYYIGRGGGPEAICEKTSWQEHWKEEWEGKYVTSDGDFLGKFLPFHTIYMSIEAPNNLKLRYSLRDENGVEITSKEVPLSEADCFAGFMEWLHLPKSIEEHLGQYTLHLASLEGGEFYVRFAGHLIGSVRGKITFMFAVDVGKEPEVYFLNNSLYILHFSSREFITVRCFSPDYSKKYVSEQISNTFRTGPHGRLVIQDINCEGAVTVEGDKSGLFASHDVEEIYNYWRPFSNCPESRLHVGDETQVSLEPPICTRLRSEPSVSTGKILDCVDPGKKVMIRGGPKCNDNWIWWKVETEDGDVGWMAEGDGNEYWLDGGRVPYTPFTADR